MQQYQWWRSKASWRSFGGQSSETQNLKFLGVMCHWWSQTLTTLLLPNNGIDVVGAEHLGAALSVNKVRHKPSSFPKLYVITDDRRSRHSFFRTTVSAQPVQSMLAQLWGWIRWDTNPQVSRNSMSLTITDTHNTIFFKQQYQRYRSKAS